MRCKGVFGSLELLDDCVVIRRTPIAGFILHGLVGEKRIAYSSISAVQFKRSGVLSGYIQFSIPGGRESTKGEWDAGTDENTVVFTNNELFEKARDIIEQRMRASRNPYPAPPPQGGASAAEQLEKLASLLDKGLLTQQEFDVQKSTLLNMSPHTTSQRQMTEPVPAPEDSGPSSDAVRMQEAMDRAIAEHSQRSANPIPQSAVPTFGKRRA